MTYSPIVYGLLPRIYTIAKSKKPVPVIAAKTRLVSQLYTQITSHNNYYINGLLFQDHILKFHRLFQNISNNSGLFLA